MMNTRFSFIASSIVIAVSSLALVIIVVGATASSVSNVAIGIEVVDGVREGAVSHMLANQSLNISQGEPMTLTEPISIYLPLLEKEYVKYPAERAALMAFYTSMNGDGWYNNSGWGTDSWHCDWYGVTCDEDGHVTNLVLDGNGQTGTIPSEIGDLPMLTVLGLTGAYECNKGGCWWSSQLRGPIPPEIGNLVNLNELYLYDNQFTSLPPEIGNLVNLSELNLKGNQLTSLPPEIGNLENLWALNLSGNQLTSIPPEIGSLVNLYHFDLIDNQLTSIPPEIGNLASLGWLHLDDNQLTSIPPEFGDLVNLQSILLKGNLLVTLPPEIGNMANLRGIDLSDNHLTSIPPEFGDLDSLQGLFLNNNQLSGLIPAFLSNLGNLYFLTLYGNPDLTCWETEEAREWALSLGFYDGPTCFEP
jgi:hypothetical protein